jgi:cell division transport system permease protein
MDSLSELDINPFLASLNISAGQPVVFDRVEQFLKTDAFGGLVQRVDYHQRKATIKKLFDISAFLKIGFLAGFAASTIVSFLLVFNTVRLAIFNRREEIGIMRLVGASNGFIAGSFLVQGLLCAFLSLAISLLASGLVFYFLGSRIAILFPGFNLFDLFKQYFWQLFLVQTLTALFLGILPSLAAIKRFLKI